MTLDTVVMHRVAASQLFDSWLTPRLDAQASAWLTGTYARMAQSSPAQAQRALVIAFGLAGRRIGNADLLLNAGELAGAHALVPEWDLSRWTLAQTVRMRLVLERPDDSAAEWLAWLDQLFAAAGLEELVALYQGLPVMPHPALLRERASEGIRANMKPVFSAVALDNPYPAAWLEEGAWNQMVLKCIFVDCPLLRVLGLARRANLALTRMLCDYAHERWAAKRVVNPMLWRPVGAWLDGGALVDLERVLSQGTVSERHAAAIALGESGNDQAMNVLARYPDLHRAFAAGTLSWEKVAGPTG
jgi:hypothetical protein